jgi:UDP-glucose 4-epimerase
VTMPRIVVTGASGNVGTALLRLLKDERPDWQITGLCRRPPAAGEDTYERVTWRSVDLSVPESERTLAEVMPGAEAVVHAAWAIQPGRDPALLDRINVDGTSRVLAAARNAGVPHLTHMSSVGAYAAADKERVVDESWPTTGIATSVYSREKARVERLLDEHDAAGGAPTVTRLRPGLIFQSDAGSEIARYFLGSFVPQRLLGRLRLPVLPVPELTVFQVVHADDVARAILSSVERRVVGGVNLATDPVVTPERAAEWLDARLVHIPAVVVRKAAAVTFAAHLQPTEPGWVDMAFGAPVMSTERARTELGWEPTLPADEVLATLFRGMRGREGTASPTMRPRRAGLTDLTARFRTGGGPERW